MDPFVEKIDHILPQAQCGNCTYQDCLSYAKAIAKGDRIDRCTLGGVELLKIIASLLERDITPYIEALEKKQSIAKLVKIKSSDCIGCSKCIKVCPVDAIVGTKKKLHTVLYTECTGCMLCISACPVNCIKITNNTLIYSPNQAKLNYMKKKARIEKNGQTMFEISNSDEKVFQKKKQYIEKLLHSKK